MDSAAASLVVQSLRNFMCASDLVKSPLDHVAESAEHSMNTHELPWLQCLDVRGQPCLLSAVEAALYHVVYASDLFNLLDNFNKLEIRFKRVLH